MTREEIIDLLKRYEAGTCSPYEKALLEKWYTTASVSRNWQWRDEEERARVQEMMRANIESRLFQEKRKRFFSVKRIAIAASLLLCCSVVFWLYIGHNDIDEVNRFYAEQAVKPGSSAALLTLADGTTIRLDDVAPGTLYAEDGISITKESNGDLKYDVDKALLDAAGKVRTNTISIPRGGQYQLTLPDGTKVRLNSATTLTYPIALVEKERRVTLNGEAYFEVAKNPAQPFKVNARDTEVLVTGTHFNVTAYSDESRVVTTLVEGGVKVSRGIDVRTLTPGQQVITSPQKIPETRQVDADFAVPWINGNFLFEDQDIQGIMRQVSRWYNVEVTFEGVLVPKKIGGTFTRSKGLEELLKHLESLSGIKFKMDERRVVVMM